MMDYVVLAVSRKILKCPATHGSICRGALLGAVFTCLFILLPHSYNLVKFVLFHGLNYIAMIKVGLRIREKCQMIKAIIFVYISAFLFGGVLGVFEPFIQEISYFFVFALSAYWMVLGIWNLLEYMAGQKKGRCRVILYTNNNMVSVQAFVDTGNRLRDTITGKPVSVISKQAAIRLFGEKLPDKVRYISFHAVGTELGYMPVFTLKKMCVILEGEKIIEKPLVAVSNEVFQKNEYELILNPDVL